LPLLKFQLSYLSFCML